MRALRHTFWVMLQAAGELGGGSGAEFEHDPYNNTVTLSLMDYMELEEVQNAINNGATLQVEPLQSVSGGSRQRGEIPRQ